MADGSAIAVGAQGYGVAWQYTAMRALAEMAPGICHCRQDLLCECSPAEKFLRCFLHSADLTALTEAQRIDCLAEIQAHSMARAMQAKTYSDYYLVAQVLSCWGRVTLPGEGLFLL